MRSWFPPPVTFELARITAREFRRNNPALFPPMRAWISEVCDLPAPIVDRDPGDEDEAR